MNFVHPFLLRLFLDLLRYSLLSRAVFLLLLSDIPHGVV